MAGKLLLFIVLGFLAASATAQSVKRAFLKDSPLEILEDKPVLIGVLTQPKSKFNKDTFPERDYVLSVNREFLEASGMVRAVPIYFDMPPEDLDALLEKLDGVHFTGGGLDLYNFTSETWHPYYVTAKRIFNYATSNLAFGNGTVHRQFLLTGICQGFELLSILASEDKNDLLRVLEYDNVLRPVFWEWPSMDDVKRNSRLFAEFEPSLLLAMAEQELAFHYHTYGVSYADYQAISALNSFFKVVATDHTVQGQRFLTALEAREHPIYALMFHPEYQMADFLTPEHWNTVRNKDTLAIIAHLGRFFYLESLRLRRLNEAAGGADALRVQQNDLHTNLDDLWGTVEAYHMSPNPEGITLEAYAVPAYQPQAAPSPAL